MNLGSKFSYHWLHVKFMRWLASMARSLQFQFKLKHFLCWKCPRGWTRPLSNHKQPKSEPKLHLTFHLMENLLWLLRQGEFDLFPVYFRFKTAKLKLFSSLILTARLTVTNVINVNTIEFAPIGESTGAIPQVNLLNNGNQLMNSDIFGAIFTLSLSILILNSQYVEGARYERVL